MTDVRTITRSSAYDTARRTVRETDELTVAHMCAATRIAAPTGAEAKRGRWFAERLHELGLKTATDEVGNVWAVSPATDAAAPRVVLASHLDTVFADGTSLDIVRSGSRISAPGISDNARGLAALIAIARALAAANWPLRTPVAFVGTVGEEGAGDLRGAKHYMAAHASDTAAFIALDGAGATRIIHAGVGSRRLRATFRGPGGHSWSDWGTANAAHAAGRAIAALTALPLPPAPRTTLTVARIGGGTSINAIPAEAWLELDLRSEARAPLAELEARTRIALAATAQQETDGRNGIACEIEVIGDRPPGATPVTDRLVRIAEEATHAMGATPQLASSSTDANVAMSMDIPAIAIGAGGNAGGTHTLDEWYDNEHGARGVERALLIVLNAAGMHER